MKRLFTAFILLCFIVTGIMGPCPTYAQDFVLPEAGRMLSLSLAFNPAILKGIKVYPDNPFRLDFILDKGSSRVSTEQLKNESTRLIKYFLASITVPEKDLWVNLSPYEKNRIIPDAFGVTEMGLDLLAQDYILKQITASLIYPEGKIGKEFWAKVYAQAKRQYGTTDVPINTFNKVWIVPKKAVVYENKDAAYVVESRLKVLLEEDYLSMAKHTPADLPLANQSAGLNPTDKKINELGSQIIRDVVIPALETEVNEGKNFSQLRQVYNSLILATWYKQKIKDSILAQAYVDKNKVTGVTINDVGAGSKPALERAGYEPAPTEILDTNAIYQRYLKAFKKGAYNYIKEDVDPATQQTVPRKYFSGGIFGGELERELQRTHSRAMLPVDGSNNAMIVKMNMAMTGTEQSREQAGKSKAMTGKEQKHAQVNKDPAMNSKQIDRFRDELEVELFKDEIEKQLREGRFSGSVFKLGHDDGRGIRWGGNALLLDAINGHGVLVTNSHIFQISDLSGRYQTNRVVVNYRNDNVLACACPKLRRWIKDTDYGSNSNDFENKNDLAIAIMEVPPEGLSPIPIVFEHIEGEPAALVSEMGNRISSGRLHQSEFEGYKDLLILKGAQGYNRDSGSPVFVKRNGHYAVVGLYGGVLEDEDGSQDAYVVPFRSSVFENMALAFSENATHSLFKISDTVPFKYRQIALKALQKIIKKSSADKKSSTAGDEQGMRPGNHNGMTKTEQDPAQAEKSKAMTGTEQNRAETDTAADNKRKMLDAQEAEIRRTKPSTLVFVHPTDGLNPSSFLEVSNAPFITQRFLLTNINYRRPNELVGQDHWKQQHSSWGEWMPDSDLGGAIVAMGGEISGCLLSSVINYAQKRFSPVNNVVVAFLPASSVWLKTWIDSLGVITLEESLQIIEQKKDLIFNSFDSKHAQTQEKLMESFFKAVAFFLGGHPNHPLLIEDFELVFRMDGKTVYKHNYGHPNRRVVIEIVRAKEWPAFVKKNTDNLVVPNTREVLTNAGETQIESGHAQAVKSKTMTGSSQDHVENEDDVAPLAKVVPTDQEKKLWMRGRSILLEWQDSLRAAMGDSGDIMQHSVGRWLDQVGAPYTDSRINNLFKQEKYNKFMLSLSAFENQMVDLSDYTKVSTELLPLAKMFLEKMTNDPRRKSLEQDIYFSGFLASGGLTPQMSSRLAKVRDLVAMNKMELLGIVNHFALRDGVNIDEGQVNPAVDQLPSAQTGKNAAMTGDLLQKGGIDLTYDRLQVQSAGGGAGFKFDKAMILQLQNSTGITPVIIDLSPMAITVPRFLGLEDEVHAQKINMR